jgi:hypothetical protein
MGIFSKIATTLVVTILGAVVVVIVGSEFGHGQYLTAGIVAVMLIAVWSRPSA